MTWQSEMKAVPSEAGGLMRLHVVRPPDTACILGAMLAGDAEATRLIRVLVDTAVRIERAPRSRPMLCGCCPRPLKGTGFAICVLYPERPDPTRCIAFAICARCSGSHAETEAKAMIAVKSIWPDSRPLTITDHIGGRA